MVTLTPYVFSHSRNFKYFNLAENPELFDCTKTSSLTFFNMIHELDRLSFSEQGMGMDRWTFYDCGAMPGAIFGLGIAKSDVNIKICRQMNIPDDYQGLVPISMFIAIPTAEPHVWFGHNLSSIGANLGLKRVGLQTKARGLLTLNIKKMYGATQWGSPAIHIHSELSEMNLVTAYTPVHSFEHSLTYFSDYDHQILAKILMGERREMLPPVELLMSNDFKRQAEIQNKLENGESFSICGRPQLKNGVWSYPIHFEH